MLLLYGLCLRKHWFAHAAARNTRTMDGWDYVIVGGGSAGCVLANRLSADPGVRVLLVEAGGPDRSPYIHVPAGIIRAVGNPALDWCHRAEPDPSRFGKVDLWPAGKTLGGSSSINGMLFVRGAREDFDAWAALGCAGWGYADVLPCFKRLERSEVGSSEERGKSGPMHDSKLRATHPLGRVFLQAAEECGLVRNSDYNGALQEGASEPQVTQRHGRRWSSARAFLHPVLRRPNLRVETGSFCRRLLIEQGRCVGIEVQRGGETIRHGAKAEVIVAAGTLGSPKLLMLSGIGPGEALRALGIRVVADRAEVGANLREHPNSLVCADVNVRTYNVEMSSPRIVAHLASWLLFGRGPATSPYPHGLAFLRSTPEETSPDVQMLFGPFAFAFDERGIVPYTAPAVSLVVNTCRPVARGRIRLRSADPAAPPVIEHALLGEEEDLRRQIVACRFARRILESEAFRPYVLREFLPGSRVQTDEQWEEHVRRTTFLGYHPVGTCRMGADAGSVVTHALEVRGIAGLRVADASIMPRHIAANTNAAVLMIAEKAADLVLATRKLAHAA
jgi:choline dehydrogenase